MVSPGLFEDWYNHILRNVHIPWATFTYSKYCSVQFILELMGLGITIYSVVLLLQCITLTIYSYVRGIGKEVSLLNQILRRFQNIYICTFF